MGKERKLRKPKATLNEVSTSEEGLRKNYTRATFIIRKDLLFKIKSIAYNDDKLIKDIINKLLLDGVAQYEREKGAGGGNKEVSGSDNVKKGKDRIPINEDPYVKYYKSLIEKNKKQIVMAKTIEGIKFYTLPEAAKILGITPQTLRKYIKQGKIKGKKLSNYYLITEKALLEFLKQFE